MIEVGQVRMMQPVFVSSTEKYERYRAVVKEIHPNYVLMQFNAGYNECYTAAEVEAAPLGKIENFTKN